MGLAISDFSNNAQNSARRKKIPPFLVGVKKLKPLGVMPVIIETHQQ